MKKHNLLDTDEDCIAIMCQSILNRIDNGFSELDKPGLLHGYTGLALALYGTGKFGGRKDFIEGLIMRDTEKLLVVDEPFLPGWCKGMSGINWARKKMGLEYEQGKIWDEFEMSKKYSGICHGLDAFTILEAK